jgi:WhiB family redox-sensing transcriptional regulator
MIDLKHLDWFDDALCRGMKTTIFFPETAVGVSTAGIYDEAVKICERCPVAEKCLAYAMECETNDIRRYGVWGGKTPREREYRRHGGTGGKLNGLAPLRR